MKPCLLGVLVLATVLPAQTYVSPASFRHSEGPASNSFPFGIATVPFRFQQVHDDVPAMTIRGLAFRHNVSNAVAPAHSLTLDAWVSTSTITSTTASTTFDNNHGADRAQVVTNRTYNLPPSNPGDLPGRFILDYPFDTPFNFAGGASVCWEVQITAKTQTSSIFYDALTAGNANPPLAVGRAFTGCISTGRTAAITATPTSTMNWAAGTGTMNVAGGGLLANGTIAYVLGTDNATWNGVALPIEVPGSSAGPSGPCRIHADTVFTLAMVATSGGTSASQMAIPAAVELNGLTIFTQIWGLDAQANAFGLTTSPLAMHNVVAPFAAPPIARIYVSGSLGATGTMQTTSTLVTAFQ